MALTYPLSVADFWGKLRMAATSFYLNEPQQIDRTAGGTVLKASLGESYWRGTGVMIPHRLDDLNGYEIEALLSVVNRAGSTFLCYDTRKPYPSADPDGSILGSSTPTISALNANNRQMNVTGLPSGYVLTAGDLIGWNYGSNPTRYTLHRIVKGVTASGAGTAIGFEVAPFIPSGTTTGTPVSLIRPVVKAVLEPNLSFGAGQGVIMPGAQFSFVQTMR
ncbi:MAG: hypothetical protein RLQ73_00560 [Hoeflea sp. D1-CHI-28]